MRPASLAGGAGFIAALAVALFLTFGNTYRSSSCSVEPGGETRCVEDSSTAVEENGAWIAVLFAIPVLLSGVVFVSVLPGVRWDKYAGRTAAVGLLLFCVVLALSLGLLFFPSLFLAILALFLDRKPRVTAG